MSKVTTTKTKTVKYKITKAIKCDVCHKEILGKYWQLTTHHNGWGNDSIDSYEYFDLCSRECINKKLDEYIKACKNSYTQEFELEQSYFNGLSEEILPDINVGNIKESEEQR